MRFLKGCQLAAVGAFVVFAAPAMAQSCAGFTDVLATNPNCKSFEWIRNRAITLGCNGPGTLYCPTQSVTREQMALFIHRLGMAMTPEELPYSPQDTINAVSLNAPG